MKISVWEQLQKEMTWAQIGNINGKKILDFGSGNGMTACHYAQNNEVVAVEPDEDVIKERFKENNYIQLCGSIDKLSEFEDNYFDIILCHNVLEYAEFREEIVKEFARLLKKDGILSILKHNLPGRVMQMVVLLNNFDHANELLDGKSGNAEKYGTINYYDDEDLLKWTKGLVIDKVLGQRTFWDLQQNQEMQGEKEWQKKMLTIESRVAEIEEYKAIAFFHHIILRKI
ncbi:MAG: methyltransferase domain-containing protein [Clostridia bacterium]|nr:methyltransferase domain-containing protein [Clostridia bacterium]